MAQQANITDLRKKSKDLTAKQMGGGSVQQLLEANKQSIAEILPQHMSPERLMKVAMHAIRTTPTLQECNTASLIGAVVQCSQLGLEPNTVLGHAYLVPFWNGRKHQKEVQLITGYKGLIDLARRSGQIETIYAHEVCQGDEFDLSLGTEPGITHRPALSRRGEIIGFYAVARMKDGGHQFEFMPREEVDTIRDSSQGYKNAIRKDKDHPWISQYAQMGRKTAIRRLANYLPLSIEFATAARLDGMAESGEAQGFESVLEGDYAVTPEEAPTAPSTEAEPVQEAEETPPAEGATPADEGQEQAAPPDEGAAPTAVGADTLIEQMDAAISLEELDELADLGKELAGAEKQRVTKAYQRNRNRLNDQQSMELE